MSNEEKLVSNEEKFEVQESKCICQSKMFKKIVAIAIGSFIGVYCALSLFTALHRPPCKAFHGGFQHRVPYEHVKGDRPMKKHHNDHKKMNKEGRPAPIAPQEAE